METPAHEMLKIRNTALIDYGQQGAMSKMKEAPGQNVLVKEIPIDPKNVGEDTLAFGNEAYMSGRLSHLRYIRGVEAFRTAGDLRSGDLRIQCFLKKVEGKQAVVPPDNDKLIEFGLEISTKLAEIQSLGIVVVDFKPQNVLNNGKEHILVDFGTSVQTGMRSSGCTLDYTSPEVFTDGLDSRHDTYCLGSAMVEAKLGQTPNEKYGNIAAIAPTDREMLYEDICKELEQKCYPDARLAKVLAMAINPDKNKRPHMHEFSKLLEELSPQFTAFPTISAEQINKVRTVGEVGALLSDMRSGLMYKRTDVPIEQQQGPYFENTNFATIGTITEAVTEPRKHYFDPNTALARRSIFKDLRSSYQNNTAPRFLLKPGESGRSMTQLERQSIQFVLTLQSLAERVPQFADEDMGGLFVVRSLQLLLDNDHFATRILPYEHVSTRRPLEGLLKGFDAQQNAKGRTNTPNK